MNTEFKVASSLQGLARRLIENNTLDQKAAEAACVQSNKKNKTLLSWLINNKSADPAALANIAADEYCIPIIDIDAFDLGVAPVSLLSEALIEKNRVLPLQ